MTGQQQIAAPRERVWAALNDPAVLRQCIPGCQSLEKESDDRLKATVEIRIGPIGARFAGAVVLSELDPPNGYTITGEGQGGMVGSAKGGARVRLAVADGGTLLTYEVDADVGGRLAQLGGPIIDATARQLAGTFFERFGAVVVGGSTAATTPPAPVRAAADRPAAPSASPIAWVLAIAVAALAGFLIGRAQPGAQGSDWEGLAIGLLVIVVAAAGFDFGRRAGGGR